MFYQPVKIAKIAYEKIRNIATSLGDDYTTGCLINYAYFRDNYKMFAVDLSKQQGLDIDASAIQQVNFTANYIE